MKKYLFLILSLFIATTVQANLITSPSEHAYYKGNQFYEDQEYNKAIEQFQKFIEENPRSNLLIPAQLNLGMSYFYTEDYLNAYQILTTIRLKDGGIKSYINDIIAECKEQAKDEIALLEQAQKDKLASDDQISGAIDIKVTKAILDGFNNLTVEGAIDKEASVTVNETDAQVTNNKFSASIRWRRGQSVIISAVDNKGNIGKIEYYPDSEPPDEPEGLYVASQSNNSMEIRWDENRENDIKGYKLYYRRQGGGWIEINEMIDENHYEIVGLSNKVQGSNRTFEFYVKAVDFMNNESDPSDTLESDLPE